MQPSDAPHEILPCIWMTAGLLSYRLCDRDYDCEHCPLDHALQGTAGQQPQEPSDRTVWRGPTHAPNSELPDDRRYTIGHTWVGRRDEDDEAVVRLGLDAFAAALVGPPRRVRALVERGGPVGAGTPVCELDLDVGMLPIRTPMQAALVAINPRLERSAAVACTDPYRSGWLAELRPLAGDDDHLDDEADTRRRTRHDLRRLRRQVAVAMLTDESGIGMTLPDGGEMVTDLRALLGGRRWLELLREFVH